MSRPAPTLEFEQPLWQTGAESVAGVDEAGRGAWAGPVSAGAVILPPDLRIIERLAGVRDSKQMTPAQRAHWAAVIQQEALACAVGFAAHQEIDLLGLLPATRLAMVRALQQLSLEPQHLLVDAIRVTCSTPQTILIHGDARSLSIAAASVLAKTARDAWMVEMDQVYPGYTFCRHKGYGTAAHQQALLRFGVCGIHRQSFAPVHNLIEHGYLWSKNEDQAPGRGLPDGR
ncbi:MAG TPA: ribonuclease HII [Levilinea sp.]|nr:ribonuclease HII [Levilinea sp.]